MVEIFLGFVFDKNKEKSLLIENKYGAQTAVNQYQVGFIDGLKRNLNIVSVLPAGTYPKTSRKFCYKADIGKIGENCVRYVPFYNAYVIKDFSQARQVYKALETIIMQHKEIRIYVYSLYMPFLRVVKKLKKRFANKIHVCLIVPDVPGKYGAIRNIWSFGGIRDRIEQKQKMKLSMLADSYVFLTEAMKNLFPKKSYTVIEGFLPYTSFPQDIERQPKTILYTGSLNPVFGIDRLLEAFSSIEEDDYELWICGAGGIQKNVEEYARLDSRIKFFGYIAKEQISILQSKCDVLINPRLGTEEFTKYSFPSKTMEYLLSGSKVVMHKLQGIPDEYYRYIRIIQGDTVDALRQSILEACSDAEFYQSKYKEQVEWIKTQKSNESQMNKLDVLFSQKQTEEDHA